MTSTTPNLTLPYPQPSDARGAGANAIRDLALAVEACIYPNGHLAQLLFLESASAAAVGGTVVVFDGTGATMANFAYDGAGAVTYTGAKSRMFMLAATVEVENGAGGGTVSSDQSVFVEVNGSQVWASHDQLALTTAELQARKLAHTAVLPLILAPGDVIRLRAYASPAGTVGYAALRVYPIGPLDT